MRTRLRREPSSGRASTSEPCHVSSPGSRPQAAPRLCRKLDRARKRATRGRSRARDARAYLFAGELVILKKTAGSPDPLFTLAEARALGRTAEIVFLGLCRGAP